LSANLGKPNCGMGSDAAGNWIGKLWSTGIPNSDRPQFEANGEADQWNWFQLSGLWDMLVLNKGGLSMVEEKR
jgi:hypothetical protein